MTTYAYTRVSTVEQNSNRQLDQLPAYDYLYEDKQSGKDLDRPQLQLMLSKLQEGDTVIILSIDRLARNVDDLRGLAMQLLEKGVTLKFIKEGLTFADGIKNASNTLVLTLIGAIAEFERALINNRCAEGRKIALANGVQFGKPSRLTEEQFADIRSKQLKQAEYAAKHSISIRYVAKIQRGVN
jgi:DNA invertase Pin-like site-specific DNA recombinase